MMYMLCVGHITAGHVEIIVAPVIDGFTEEAFWDEVESRPGMADLLTDDEALNDPNYTRWLAEGSPKMQWNWDNWEPGHMGITTRPVDWPVI